MAVGIPLGRGIFAIVDDEDVMPAMMFGNWFNNKENYPSCKKNNERIFLHNFIAKRMGLVGRIDHKNKNPLDCRRENLRLASASQNNVNRSWTQKSGLRGVRKVYNRWQTQITYKGEKHYLGSFETEEAAARAYDAEAKKQFGDFAILNFPEEK